MTKSWWVHAVAPTSLEASAGITSQIKRMSTDVVTNHAQVLTIDSFNLN